MLKRGTSAEPGCGPEGGFRRSRATLPVQRQGVLVAAPPVCHCDQQMDVGHRLIPPVVDERDLGAIEIRVAVDVPAVQKQTERATRSLGTLPGAQVGSRRSTRMGDGSRRARYLPEHQVL